MENRLKTLGIISDFDSTTAKSIRTSSLLKDIDIETVLPLKKVDTLHMDCVLCLQGCLKYLYLQICLVFLFLLIFCVDEGNHLVYAPYRCIQDIKHFGRHVAGKVGYSNA